MQRSTVIWKQAYFGVNKLFHNSKCTSVVTKFCAKQTITHVQYRCISSNYPEDYGKYAESGAYESVVSSFTDSSLIHSVEVYLTSVHDLTHLPWWASIVASTFLLRGLIMTPLTIHQMKNIIKHQTFLPILQKLHDKLHADAENAAEKKNWDEQTKLMNFHFSYNQHKKKLLKDNKIPGALKRYGLPFVQIPVWVSMSIAIRHLTLNLQFLPPSAEILAVSSQLSTEGCLWFSDLCQIDPYFVLPTLLCFINLSIIEIHRGGRTELSGMNKLLVYGMRGVAFILLPVASQMPAGVVVYWLSSSLYGALQALVLKSSAFKKRVKIPISNAESKTPYRDLINRLTKKNKT